VPAACFLPLVAVGVILKVMPTVSETAEPKLAGPHGGGPRDLWPDDPGGGGGDDGGESRYIPDAGLFAMRFVLLSITTLFITIGMAYFTRSRTGFNWQHIRVPRMLWLAAPGAPRTGDAGDLFAPQSA
jgi:hypothetical protein